MQTDTLQLKVYDLGLPEAVAFLTRAVGAPTVKEIIEQAGATLFVVHSRNSEHTMAWTPNENAVLEAVAAGLAGVVANPWQTLKLDWKVGPRLDAKLKALLAAHASAGRVH